MSGVYPQGTVVAVVAVVAVVVVVVILVLLVMVGVVMTGFRGKSAKILNRMLTMTLNAEIMRDKGCRITVADFLAQSILLLGIKDLRRSIKCLAKTTH